MSGVAEEHSACLGGHAAKGAPASKGVFLRAAVSKVLAVSKSTRPKDVQQEIELHYGQKIPYRAAYSALTELRGSTIEAQREEFRMLLAYVDALARADSTGRFLLDTEDVTWKFQRLFVCPSSSRTIFCYCPKFIACDGTFTKARFRQILLFAATIDGNDEIVLLAWAIVESENEGSWLWFFEHLKRDIPELETEPFTLISDRDKGLVKADGVFPNAVRAYCCLHIAENV